MKLVNVSVGLGLMFVIINSVRIKINADKNAKNYLIKDLFGTLVIVSVNVIKRVILVNISTMKIVSAEKS